jgi:hypothetical protein
MLVDFLRNIVYVVAICVFLFLILGRSVVEGFEGTTDEGTTDEGTTDEGTTDEGTTDKGTTDKGTTDKGTTDKGTTDKGISSSDVSKLFTDVNTQADIIRTFKGEFEPPVPIKIDNSGDERIILLKNIKLLLNNGVFKNETDLKSYEYMGNKDVSKVVSDINNLNLENPSSINTDKLEEEFVKRTQAIIEEHRKIIDLELKRREK